MNFNDDEVVGLLNRLLEMLHQADGNNQGSIVFNVYSSGSLHVDHVDTQNFYGDACPKTKTLPDPPCVGREKGKEDTPTLPPSLCTEQAMMLWRKAQAAGWTDDNYQPLLSRTQAALLANYMADKLGINDKWKIFEAFWNRKYMSSDYNLALNQQQSLDFQEELKKIMEK
jgi:hypothetical protein